MTDVQGPVGIPGYGNWEAFAWDGTYGYVTNDDTPSAESPNSGVIIRYTPGGDSQGCLSAGDDAGKWCVLNSGTHEYLKINTDGTFEWVANIDEANPGEYAGSEGLDVTDGIMSFVTVFNRDLFRLNLSSMTYTKKPLPFPQEPDNIRMLGGTLYLCTDGDYEPNDAIWGWDANGAYKVAYEVRNIKCQQSNYSDTLFQIDRKTITILLVFHFHLMVQGCMCLFGVRPLGNLREKMDLDSTMQRLVLTMNMAWVLTLQVFRR